MSHNMYHGDDDEVDDDLEPLYDDERRQDRWQHTRLKVIVTSVVAGVICILIALVVVIVVAKLHGLHDAVNLTPSVPTSCGSVLGHYQDRVYVFKGVRYAEAPVGPLRWRPPQQLDENSITNCQDTYKAFTFGSQCYQRNKHNEPEGSEDCLFLNVWTPQLDNSAKLPVMVFIHGGGLISKSGNEPGETPTTELVRTANMVFVTFNYRLGPLGFLALDVLSFRAQEGVSGNYGFLDQAMALIWVRDNINNFGGDPSKVTIYGHESGGESVFALLMSPQARGLFQQAWIMSGIALFNTSRQQAEADNLIFLNTSGCSYPSSVDSEACLRSLPARQVVSAMPWAPFPSWDRQHQWELPTAYEQFGAIGIVDGRFLPRTPISSLEAGDFNDVPIIIGNTAQAAEESAPETMSDWTWQDDDNYITIHLDTLVPNLANLSRSHYPHQVSPEYQFTSMVTDIRVTCPSNQQVELVSQSLRSPVYRYVVTSVPSRPVHHRGRLKQYAFQSWDLLAFFGTLSQYLESPTKEDLLFSHNLRQMAFEFARTGRLAHWKQFPEATIVMSKQSEPISDYKHNVCNFWKYYGIVPKFSIKS